MYAFQRHILEAIAARLREKLGDRITRMYAFGSRVRGDHHEWSDLDVLVVVKEKNPHIQREIVEMFVDSEMESGIPFSVVIKEERVFNLERSLNSPFYQNIMREGVSL
jgi:uncharacterized protein